MPGRPEDDEERITRFVGQLPETPPGEAAAPYKAPEVHAWPPAPSRDLSRSTWPLAKRGKTLLWGVGITLTGVLLLALVVGLLAPRVDRGLNTGDQSDSFPAYRDTIMPRIATIDGLMAEAGEVNSRYNAREISASDAWSQLKAIHDEVVNVSGEYPYDQWQRLPQELQVLDDEQVSYGNRMFFALQDQMYCIRENAPEYCQTAIDWATKGETNLQNFLLGMRRYAIRECEEITWPSNYQAQEEAKLREEGVQPTGLKCIP